METDSPTNEQEVDTLETEGEHPEEILTDKVETSTSSSDVDVKVIS